MVWALGLPTLSWLAQSTGRSWGNVLLVARIVREKKRNRVDILAMHCALCKPGAAPAGAQPAGGDTLCVLPGSAPGWLAMQRR